MSNLQQTNFADLIQRNVSGVAFELAKAAGQLEAYGEHEVAAWLPTIDSDVHARISMRAHQIPGMLDKAICLACVEILEGKARPLKRRRRAFPKNDS